MFSIRSGLQKKSDALAVTTATTPQVPGTRDRVKAAKKPAKNRTVRGTKKISCSLKWAAIWVLQLWFALVVQSAWAATSASNTATIAPPAGVLDNVGGCTTATPPACAGNNTSTATVSVWTAVTGKTASPASGVAVLPGAILTYSLSVTVTGAATTAPVVLTDTLGTGLSFVAVTSNTGGFTASTAGNPLTFTLPTGAAIGVYTVQYTARVATSATGSVGNSVVGSANCTAAAPCTTSHPIGALTLTKVLTTETGSQAGLAEAGETLTYTITINNTSGTVVSNYALTDTFGAGLTYVSSNLGGVNTGQSVNWSNLNIPANGSLQVSVVVTVNVPITVDSVSNLAKPTGSSDPTCPSAACVVTPAASTVTVAKVSSPANGTTVIAGQSITYTLTATVTGGKTTSPTVLTDTLGSGQTFGAVTSAGAYTVGTVSALVHTFTLPTGTVAGTYAVSYTATVNTGATTGTVNNTVTGVACTTVGACATDHPVGAIGITKALTSESGSQSGMAEAGEQLGYTITLGNPTSTAVTAYALTDTLSAGLSYVSSTLGGVNSGQTINWTNLTIPAGGTLQLGVVALVGPITSVSVSNLAKPTGGTDPSCPGAACVVTPTTSTVTVAKTANTASGTTVIPGQTLSYTLTATVTGSATSAPTVLTDTLSAGQTYVGVSSAGVFSVATISPLVHSFTLPAGTPAGSYAVTYTVTVNAGATGAVGNSVSGVACTSGGVCATTHPVGAIGVTKALTSESGSRAGIAEAGETLGYTLTLTNPAAAPVTGYALTDILSAGLSYVNSSGGGVNSGQTITWTGLTIPANGTLQLTVTASVNSPISTASVSNLVKTTGDPDPGCPSVACVLTPTASTVTVAKAANPATGATVIAGQSIVYTLTATVSGGATTAATVLTDTLGSGQTYAGVTSAGVYSVATVSPLVHSFTLPAGTAAGTYAVSYAATVNTGASTGTVNNSVTGVACTTVGACATDHPVGAVGLSKALTGESLLVNNIAQSGEQLTYTITLTNPTATPVAGYALTDTLGAGLTYVSASPSGSNTGQTTSWAGLVIPANGALQVLVVASVNTPITVASVSNLAKPTGSGDPACPSAACVVTPTASTMSVIKSSIPASGATVIAGQTISYTVTATVTGGSTTTPAVLVDTLGSGQTFGSVTSAGAFAVGGTGNTRTFTLPVNTPAGTYSVIYTATVNSGATNGTVNNAVSGLPCTVLGACVTDHPVGAISVTKALTSESIAANGVAEAGEIFTYTITLANPTAAPVTGYALTDRLSAGLTYVSATNGGVNAGQTTTWTGLTIPANGVLHITVVASVNVPIATASVGNLAKPTGGTDPTCPSSACVLTPTVNTVTLAKAASPASGAMVIAGQTVTYTLTATVSGAPTALPMVLADNLGSGQTFGAVTSLGIFAVAGTGNLRSFTLPANTAAGTYAVTYTATVNASATAGTVTNVVTGANCIAAGACATEHTLGSVGLTKALTAETGSQAGIAEAGETLTYTITLSNATAAPVTGYALTDTLDAGLTYVSASLGGVNAGQTTNWSSLTIPANGSLQVNLLASVNAPVAVANLRNLAKPTGGADPACPSQACVVTPTAAQVTPTKQLTSESGTRAGVAEAGETLTYTITLVNSGGAPWNNYRFTENVPAGATMTGVSGASGFSGPVTGPAMVNLVVPAVPGGGSATVGVVFLVASSIPSGLTVLPNLISGGDIDPACATACKVTVRVEEPAEVNIIKTSAVREAKVGDLVRYTLTLTNSGNVNLVGGRVTDTPPTGFSYVASSASVADGDGAFELGASASPLQFSGIDVAVGKQAVISYLLRVGAGVRQGGYVNQAMVVNTLGQVVSNVATAEVQVVADPLVDESLILGTVFHDLDGNGWQAPASLTETQVKGGFAPGAYLPNTTSIDRGNGPQTEADASAPLLHGIAVGTIAGRQSQADPVEKHRVLIRQRLSALAFTDDFVLSTRQGVTVRMDAAGRTTTEKTGDAAKGLNGAAPEVERRVSIGEGGEGYLVDYIITNVGIDERGIPGVRITSVEGLLIETDQYGRYNVVGVPGGDWNRGRNFILKVDPTTLPDGAEFTTVNPLVRRITPGLPVRFDFGVKLPQELLRGRRQIDIEMGEVLFAPGSSELRNTYLPAIEALAAKIDEYDGGEVLIRANGESPALALSRVSAVDKALRALVKTSAVNRLQVTARTELVRPETMLVGVQQERILLGTVLFDTDQSVILPAFRPLLLAVARALEKRGGGVVSLVGHADIRASDSYNLGLGMRRAKAVLDAISKELTPAARARVRVEPPRVVPQSGRAPSQ